MSAPNLQFLDVSEAADQGGGQAPEARRIAVLSRPGQGPSVVWLGGFRSDMRATKAEALDGWAERAGRRFVRFDYTGHGESSGRFEDGTISRWLADSLAVIAQHVPDRPVLVGSSMGGWLALLAARALRATMPENAPLGLVLIAPAVDFTERLMWDAFPPEAKRAIETDGAFMRPSAYADEPYAITRGLIEDGRHNLMFGAPIEPGCPVHILQGMEDPDVPWQHAMQLLEHLPGEAATITLIKDGDHRLSRPQDIDRLIAATEAIA